VANLWARPRDDEDDEWQVARAAAASAAAPDRDREPIGFADEQEPADADADLDAYAARASFGYRLGAVCIDAGAASGAALVAGLSAAAAGAGDRTTVVLAGVVWVATWLAATAGVTELSGGATLGKLAGGMRVVHARDGRPLGAEGSFVRDSLLRLLYAVPFFGLVDSAFASGDDRRALRDRMAGTLVLRTARYGARAGVVSLAATIGIAGSLAAVGLGIRDDLRRHDVRGALPGYTMADRNAFMFDCTRRLGPQRCGCIYDHISRQLPYERFVAGDLFGTLRDAERAC
jgi:uncharacterized RDD family membrane protein YckC